MSFIMWNESCNYKYTRTIEFQKQSMQWNSEICSANKLNYFKIIAKRIILFLAMDPIRR